MPLESTLIILCSIFLAVLNFSAVAVKMINLPGLLAARETKYFTRDRKLSGYLRTCRNPHYGDPWLFCDWQVREIRWTCAKEFKTGMHLRNRGGSKTRDMAIAAVFLAYQHNEKGEWNHVVWFAGADSQIEQVHEYFDQNRYVDHTHSSWDTIRLWNGNYISLRVLTAKQVVSKRADYLFFDEEQSMDEKIYKDALGILIGSGGRIVHMGTTELDSVLEKNYNILQPKGLVHEHHIDECWWTTVEKAMEVYEGQPRFVIESQLYCKWVHAGGEVFQNIEVRDLTALEKQLLQAYVYYGLDPNPKSGHALVRTRVFIPSDKTKVGFIYVEHEVDSKMLEDRYKDNPAFLKPYLEMIKQKYHVDYKNDHVLDDSELMVLYLWANSIQSSSYEIEENNGQEFIKTLKRITQGHFLGKVGLMCWDEDKKAQRVFGIRRWKLIINPKCVNAIHHIKTAVWNPKDPTAKLLKTPEQHFLDGFIHSCQFVNGTSVGMMKK